MTTFHLCTLRLISLAGLLAPLAGAVTLAESAEEAIRAMARKLVATP